MIEISIVIATVMSGIALIISVFMVLRSGIKKEKVEIEIKPYTELTQKIESKKQKINFAKRKEIIELNSQEGIKHKENSKINPLYEKALELEKRGKHKESIETYEEIIDINEYYKKAWEGLERIYNALGDSENRYSALEMIRLITEIIDFETNAAQKINLQQFELQNLDFFGNLFWSFQPQINILLGRNGYGKTYLLRLLISMLQKEDNISSEFFKESKSNSFVRCDLERNNIAKAIYRTKTVFKELYLFSIDAEFEDNSNNGIIAKKLRNKFKIESFPISANAKVTKENDDKWAITDGEKIYIVKKEEGKLNIYKESIGKVPVLAIPDMRLVDKSTCEEVIQNFLYELCIRYMAKGNSFEQPLFELLHTVVHELTDKKFKFNEIVAVGDAKFKINVITEGNLKKPLPLQKASQGTLSVLSIFGLIYYYLTSVFPDTPEEELLKKPAIVFIDEVDAHLHPSWQQRIIGLLRDSFPNVQFIVTAYNPLVVAGCYENEVAVLRKGEKGFTIENFEEHFIGTDISELNKKIFETEDIDVNYLKYATLYSMKRDNSARITELEAKSTLSAAEQEELDRLYKEDYYVSQIPEIKMEKEEKENIYEKEINILQEEIRELKSKSKEEPKE
jgi:ABC-type multidrug transport system ATPase subunit